MMSPTGRPLQDRPPHDIKPQRRHPPRRHSPSPRPSSCAARRPDRLPRPSLCCDQSESAHHQPRSVFLLARQPFPTAPQRRLLAGDGDVLLDQRLVPQAVGCDAQALRGDAELSQHIAEADYVLLEIAVGVTGVGVVVPVGQALVGAIARGSVRPGATRPAPTAGGAAAGLRGARSRGGPVRIRQRGHLCLRRIGPSALTESTPSVSRCGGKRGGANLPTPAEKANGLAPRES